MQIPKKVRSCPATIFRRRRLVLYNPKYVYESELKKTRTRIENNIDSLPVNYFINNLSATPTIGETYIGDTWGDKTPTRKKVGHKDLQFTEEDFLTASDKYHYTQSDLTQEQLDNSKDLLKRVNSVLALAKQYTKNPESFVINSGFRSNRHQMEVNPSSPESPHTKGLALDISDPTGELKKIIMEHPEIAEEIEKQGLNVENFMITGNWVHFDTMKRKNTGNEIWTGKQLREQQKKYLDRKNKKIQYPHSSINK